MWVCSGFTIDLYHSYVDRSAAEELTRNFLIQISKIVLLTSNNYVFNTLNCNYRCLTFQMMKEVTISDVLKDILTCQKKFKISWTVLLTHQNVNSEITILQNVFPSQNVIFSAECNCIWISLCTLPSKV